MMTLILKILGQLLLRREFIELEGRQRNAVIDAILLSVVPPGMCPATERLSLRLDLLAMPWCAGARVWDACQPHDSPRLQHCFDDPAALLRFATTLRRELDDAWMREQVYRIAVGLALADGGTEQDLRGLDPIRAGLELPIGRGIEIVDEVKDAVVAMVI